MHVASDRCCPRSNELWGIGGCRDMEGFRPNIRQSLVHLPGVQDGDSILASCLFLGRV